MYHMAKADRQTLVRQEDMIKDFPVRQRSDLSTMENKRRQRKDSARPFPFTNHHESHTQHIEASQNPAIVIMADANVNDEMQPGVQGRRLSQAQDGQG